ncbi:hypothetical protein TVAG_057140 [Trichomonas vaginalis G3]|uniref:Uncharacterized protein n=1 Tax=Trichomonas vaginalis (strain ATCC PRA-98 / G3) TaxID=412133 RepID=A2EKC2_TRIV3|nr:hypothetical protein TVAGG3_0772600 [Trichomonas vaginalis G3]EAY06920.1 hypothetical protein TVAG_057140 [Trichomonas vaginalis G3]KAI5513915.1 hypothetical protein TVAGG3_0772600 [Trichomonas vaginalis G3]|eukprot:XP_001319143.1 hypothetical protein [Trichomonas vaginalis G3]
MEVLESFVSNVSLSDVFEVRIGNEPPFKAKCAIKFVFLFIYAKESTKIIFIPDYSPAISFGSKKSGQILMLTPIYDEINSLIFLESEVSTSIDAFFNLSAGAILALDKFYQLFTDFIQIKHHLIGFIPPKIERPIHLVLEKDQILFDDNEIVIYTYQITKRLQFHILDNINDEFSRIKLINYNEDNIRLQLFSEKDVLVLFLAFLVNKYIATEEINNQITKLNSSLSVDGLNETQQEENENKIGSLETKVKINTKKDVKEQIQEEIVQITDNNLIDNSSEKNDKLIQDLKSKLTNYKRKVYTNQDKEPVLEKISPIQEEKQKIFIPENSNFIKSQENLIDLCNNRLKYPYANLSHYFQTQKSIQSCLFLIYHTIQMIHIIFLMLIS